MNNKASFCKLIITILAIQCCNGNLSTKSNAISAGGKFSDELKRLDVLESGKIAQREAAAEVSGSTTDQNKRSIQLVKQAIKEIRAQ